MPTKRRMKKKKAREKKVKKKANLYKANLLAPGHNEGKRLNPPMPLNKQIKSLEDLG